MLVTLEIPPPLEQRLRTLANRHGLSLEQVSEQVLVAGLLALGNTLPEQVLQSHQSSAAFADTSTPLQMPSPLQTQGIPRTLPITVEPADEN
jgi:plasmid stability protein